LGKNNVKNEKLFDKFKFFSYNPFVPNKHSKYSGSIDPRSYYYLS